MWLRSSFGARLAQEKAERSILFLLMKRVSAIKEGKYRWASRKGKKNPHFETTSIPNAPFFAFLVSILSVAAVLWEGLILQYPHFQDSYGGVCSCKVQKSWWFHLFNRSRQAFELLCAWTKPEFAAFITDLIQLPMKSAGVFPFKSVWPLGSE